MILVSIIVPVYNTEKYLTKCIKSLLQQTIEDIEIIAIDDGSQDRSGNILDLFQKEYPEKMRVFHQRNAGISAVRNQGLILARGKYIAFIDSDDSVELKFCERLVSKMESDNLDMVVCDFFEVRGEEQKRVVMPSIEVSTVYERPELLFSINTSPWNKLYRANFLKKNQIDFPLGLKYEDTVFVQKILALGAKIGCINQPLVYYAIHDMSESTVVKENVFDIFTILDIVCENYQKVPIHCYKKIYRYLEYFVINRVTVYNFQQIYQKEKGIVSRFIIRGFKYLNSSFPEWRKNKYFNQNNSWIKRLIKKHISLTICMVKAIKLFSR